MFIFLLCIIYIQNYIHIVYIDCFYLKRSKYKLYFKNATHICNFKTPQFKKYVKIATIQKYLLSLKYYAKKMFFDELIL